MTARRTAIARLAPILIPVISVIAFALAFEGAIRLIGPDLGLPSQRSQFRFDQGRAAAHPHHVRDPILGWRLKPSQARPITTNSRGFRTPEFTLRPAPERLRLVFYGDSNPLGFGLTDDEAPYPRRTPAVLGLRFGKAFESRIESINLGVDGYSSHQTRLLFEEMDAALGAGVVIIQAAFNDYCLAGVSDADRVHRGSGVLDALESSHAYRWMRRVVLVASGRSGSLRDPVRRVDVSAYEDNLRIMVRAAASRGARVLLVDTPARPSVPLVVNEVPVVRPDGTTRWVTQDRWLRERLVRAGLDPPDQPQNPQYLEVMRSVLGEHPDWPHLHYMMARALQAQGSPDVAAPHDVRWPELDSEREVYDTYRAAMMRVARAEGATFVDTRLLLDQYRATLESTSADLYLDFVHLDGRGHVIVATEIARILAGWLVEERGRGD